MYGQFLAPKGKGNPFRPSIDPPLPAVCKKVPHTHTLVGLMNNFIGAMDEDAEIYQMLLTFNFQLMKLNDVPRQWYSGIVALRIAVC